MVLIHKHDVEAYIYDLAVMRDRFRKKKRFKIEYGEKWKSEFHDLIGSIKKDIMGAIAHLDSQSSIVEKIQKRRREHGKALRKKGH